MYDPVANLNMKASFFRTKKKGFVCSLAKDFKAVKTSTIVAQAIQFVETSENFRSYLSNDITHRMK